jgi:hypothetical protein
MCLRLCAISLAKNEKININVLLQMGQSLQKSEAGREAEVCRRLEGLRSAWARLGAAARDKGARLRQAAAQRDHRRYHALFALPHLLCC